MKLKINSNFKYGFTLAEVLIALVIVGIVAALVISPLINTYVESSTVAKVKKGLSILGQAKKLAETQSGSVDGWEFEEEPSSTSAAQFFSYLKPHLSIAKDCVSFTNCLPDYNVKYLKGTPWSNFSVHSQYYTFVLADGSIMLFRTLDGKCNTTTSGYQNVCAMFFYDTNADKEPNTLGKDFFYFFFTKDGVFPNLTDDCYKNSTGYGCSGYIIKNNNMNYLH